MSQKSAKEIVDYLKTEEWQKEKKAYIAYFGFMPSIIEQMDEANRLKITFAELRQRILKCKQ